MYNSIVFQRAPKKNDLCLIICDTSNIKQIFFASHHSFYELNSNNNVNVYLKSYSNGHMVGNTNNHVGQLGRNDNDFMKSSAKRSNLLA